MGHWSFGIKALQKVSVGHQSQLIGARSGKSQNMMVNGSLRPTTIPLAWKMWPAAIRDSWWLSVVSDRSKKRRLKWRLCIIGLPAVLKLTSDYVFWRFWSSGWQSCRATNPGSNPRGTGPFTGHKIWEILPTVFFSVMSWTWKPLTYLNCLRLTLENRPWI